MSKKKSKEWANFGSITLEEHEVERASEITSRQQGVIMAIKSLSEQLGDLQASFDKLWMRLRKKYDFPHEPNYRAWLDYYMKSIVWRKREE